MLAAALAVVFFAVVRCKRGAEPELRTRLYRAAGGACGVAAAYVMFLGSGLVPLFYPGVDDRTNTLAAFGFVVALVLSRCACGSADRAACPWVTAVVVTMATFVIGVGFIQRVREDVRRYDAATVEQRHFLKRLKTALPRPRHGLTIFTFGSRAEVAPGVPIFQYAWDLQAAISLRWNDRSLEGVPIYGRGVSCSRTGVRPLALRRACRSVRSRSICGRADAKNATDPIPPRVRVGADLLRAGSVVPTSRRRPDRRLHEDSRSRRRPPNAPGQSRAARRNVREEQAARNEHKSAQPIALLCPNRPKSPANRGNRRGSLKRRANGSLAQRCRKPPLGRLPRSRLTNTRSGVA